MKHLEKARMYFGGRQLTDMQRMTHDAIVQCSEKLGPEGGRPKPVIGPVEPPQPSLFIFDVYATEEQNSTKAHLDEEDIFNDRIGKLFLQYEVKEVHALDDEHSINLLFRRHDGSPLSWGTWQVDPHFKETVIRQERTNSISRVIEAAKLLACQHHQCNVGFRDVALYLKKIS